MEHVQDLCHRHGIELRLVPKKEFVARFGWGGGGCAELEPKRVWLTEAPDDDLSYACALHEIGHLALLPAFPTSEEKHHHNFYSITNIVTQPVLDVENRAWMWAKKNALVWTGEMEKEAQRCLGTYVSGVHLHLGG